MKNYPYEAEAAKEKAELRQQLKAARKERRASDKKAAQTAKKKKAWAATTAASQHRLRGHIAHPMRQEPHRIS